MLVYTLIYTDGISNDIFMEAANWPEYAASNTKDGEVNVRFPSRMLKSKSVARMVTFSSK